MATPTLPQVQPDPAQGPAGFNSWADYQQAFDRKRKEAEFLRLASSQSQRVNAALKNIQNARRFLAMRKLSNNLQSGMPFAQAVAQSPEAFMGTKGGMEFMQKTMQPKPQPQFVPAQGGAPAHFVTGTGGVAFPPQPEGISPGVRLSSLKAELEDIDKQLEGHDVPELGEDTGVLSAFQGNDEEKRAKANAMASLMRRRTGVLLRMQQLQGSEPVEQPQALPSGVPAPVAPVQAQGQPRRGRWTGAGVEWSQ